MRNPTISKLLYINKSIEQFASGFKRVDRLCKDAAIRYEYENLPEGFMFTFFRKEKISLDKALDYLSPLEKSVYSLIASNNQITYGELSVSCGKTRKSIQRTISSLKARNIIRREGSDKSGYWKIIS